MEQTSNGSEIQALVAAGLMALLVFLSWWTGRRTRQVLSRILGREIQEGEETSLRAWMAVPSERFTHPDAELGGRTGEQVLAALSYVGQPRLKRGEQEHQPWSTHTSIR